MERPPWGQHYFYLLMSVTKQLNRKGSYFETKSREQRRELNTVRLERDKIGSLLLRYSIPAIVGMVATSLYNIVDRAFIGHGVGPLAISGLTLTFPLMTLIAAIGTLVGIGASARLSIVLGMKDIKWARNILGNALILTFVLSALFITLTMIYLPEILAAFGGSEQTIPYAIDYLKIVIPGSVLTNLSYSFGGMMRAAGYPQKSMYTVLIGVILNISLDPIFIFGFKMGIQGAAVATVISMFVSAIFVMSHFFNPKHEVHFKKGCMHLRRYIIRNIISIGMAPFLMNVAACGVNVIMNHQLVRQGGDLAIGAYGILNSYAILVAMSVMGLCQGMQPIVGYNYGAQKYKRMKDTFLLTLKIGTLVTTVGFVICELFAGVLVNAFTSDGELKLMAVRAIRLGFIMLPMVGFQVVVANFFQSISKAPKAIFLSLSRQVICRIPLLYFFSEWLGLTGVWLSIPFSDLFSALMSLVFILREKNSFYPSQQRRA